MGTPGRQTKNAAVHEYVHLLVKHSGAELPVWLNEGLAELYSTFEPQGKQVAFGKADRVLGDRKWLALKELMSVDYKSPHFDERDRTKVFYAQSWALTHMLCLSKPYSQRFSDFLKGVDGGTGEEAFRWVYGKTLDQVESDFKRYVVQKRLPTMVYEIRLNKSVEKPKVQPTTETEVSLVKAGMLAGLKRREEALEIYRDLARRYPGDWRIPEALGYLASYSGDEESARRHFARAVELEAANPRLHYDFARLLQEADAEPEVIKAVLRKAIALKPDFDDGHRLLGSILLLEGKAGMALAQLMRVKQISREEAVPHYQTVAQLYHRMGRLEAARQAAILCRKYARSSEEVDLAEELMEWLGVGSEDAPHEAPPPLAAAGTPGTAAFAPHREESDRPLKAPTDRPGSRTAPHRVEVQGSFSRLDCLGERARLHLLVEGEPLALAILDASAVRVSGPDTGQVDLSCGEQEPRPVTVEYQPSEDTDFGTAGIVKAIQFR
jgi:tetratricopeptide (TPR) repeat protein